MQPTHQLRAKPRPRSPPNSISAAIRATVTVADGAPRSRASSRWLARNGVALPSSAQGNAKTKRASSTAISPAVASATTMTGNSSGPGSARNEAIASSVNATAPASSAVA